MKNFSFLFITLIAICLIFGGCGSDNSTTPTGPITHTYSITPILYNLIDLATIGNTGHYELWAKIGSENISILKFDIAGNTIRKVGGDQVGTLGTQFTVTNSAALTTATSVFITVEPSGDSDTTPSNQMILKGNVVDSKTTLNPGYAIIEGGNTQLLVSSDVANISGSYRLVSNQKISFTSETGSPLLTLSALNSNWTYGAWLVNKNTNTAELIGKFATAESAPDKTFSSSITNGQYDVIITAEPAGSTNTQPFTLLKLLYTTIQPSASGTNPLNYKYC